MTISGRVYRYDYKDKPVSMWTLIPQKLMPPTRLVRYCRDEYQKEAARLDRIGDIVPLLRQMAGIAGFEIIGRIPLRDKATGKEYR